MVWVKDGDDMPAYVGVSQHGNYKVQATQDVRFQDTHAKVVYNQDGGLTHDFRFANEDDDNIENHTGQWFVSLPVLLFSFFVIRFEHRIDPDRQGLT